MPTESPAATPSGSSAEALYAKLRAGDRNAISEALNLIDDQRPERRRAALDLLDRIARKEDPERGLRVGITGAPGAGKSTLLNAVVRELRQRDRSVGVIAVDPSSRRTGGALLGDRVRLRSTTNDTGVFLRSMAARDRLGGLADATFAGVEILSSVFDWVFVETVGVGQSEGDIAPLVDSLVFVAQPSAGDMLQFMKAGIIELPDIFLVNKADLGAAAERTASELQAGLGLGERDPSGWEAPVLVASARDGVGVEALVEAIEDHRAHLAAGDALGRARAEGRESFLLESLERRYGSYGLESVGGREGVLVRARKPSGHSIFGLVLEIGSEIEARLGASRAS